MRAWICKRVNLSETGYHNGVDAFTLRCSEMLAYSPIGKGNSLWKIGAGKQQKDASGGVMQQCGRLCIGERHRFEQFSASQPQITLSIPAKLAKQYQQIWLSYRVVGVSVNV